MDVNIRTNLIEFLRSWTKARSGKTIFWRTACNCFLITEGEAGE